MNCYAGLKSDFYHIGVCPTFLENDKNIFYFLESDFFEALPKNESAVSNEWYIKE